MATDVMTDFAKVKEQITEMKEQAKKAAKDAFAQGTKAIFDAHPTLNGFAWNQYTPYFNDGDPCVFRSGAHDAECFFNTNTAFVDGEFIFTKSSEDGEYDDEFEPGEPVSYKSWFDGWYSRDDNTPEAKIAHEVQEFLKVFDDDDYLDLFDDHVKVIVRRDGVIDVGDFDHD